MDDENLYSINGVEIFSAGKWNGDEYTIEDLNEMEKAFNENKLGFRPYLKLGHDEKQKLLQNDGMPAAGYVDKLYVNVTKLVADFIDIPEKIYKLIKKKAYRKVSAEIFWNLEVDKKKYKRFLACVSLLGADVPGVMNLSDILGQYSLKLFNKNNYEKLSVDNIKEFNLDLDMSSEGEFMEEKELLEKALQDAKQQADLAQEEIKKFKLEAEEKEKANLEELAALKKFKADAEAKEIELQKTLQAEKLEKFVIELKSEKLCSPAMAPIINELLGDDKKEYTINNETKSKQDLMKEMLKLFKAACEVNFDESSLAVKQSFASKDEELDKAAKEYMDKNKCSYSKALKECMKMQEQKQK